MNDTDLMKLLLNGEGYLKQTTVGYKGHPSDWYNNQTTMWYKGISQLDKAVAELKRRLDVVITISGTNKLTATIKVP